MLTQIISWIRIDIINWNKIFFSKLIMNFKPNILLLKVVSSGSESRGGYQGHISFQCWVYFPNHGKIKVNENGFTFKVKIIRTIIENMDF